MDYTLIKIMLVIGWVLYLTSFMVNIVRKTVDKKDWYDYIGYIGAGIIIAALINLIIKLVNYFKNLV